MQQVTIADIRSRLKALQTPIQSDKNRVLMETAQNLIRSSKRVSDIKKFIEGCTNSNSQMPFFMYCELFESICKFGNTSDISNIASYITENTLPKVRDAKAANSLLKRRLTVAAHKASVSNVSKDLENLAGNFSSTITTSSFTPSVDSTPVEDTSENDQAVYEAYNMMHAKSMKLIHCDRIIENYNRISKRFNIDKLFIENNNFDTADIVLNLCEMIDTYDMPTSIKFNTVIETAYYGFESNSITYNKSDILESAVDYFLFKPDGVDSCREILEATMLYDKKNDMKNIDILQEEDPEEKPETVSEAIINSYAIRNIQPVAESTDINFNTIFNKFKKEELGKSDKPQNIFSKLIDKLYQKDIDGIVDGTPDLLLWTRRLFILGTLAVPFIGPIIAGIGMIADRFITIHKDRQEFPKMVKCFNNEIKACKAKLNDLEGDKKEKMKQYIKSLESARDKINSYYMDLLTDEEQEKMYETDGSFNDSDLDDLFDENNIITILNNSITSFIECATSNPINYTSMYRLMFNIDESCINIMAKIACRHPDMFFKEAVLEGCRDNASALRTGRIECDSYTKSMRLSSLNSAINILERNDLNQLYINTDIYNLVEVTSEFEAISEAYNAIAIMIDTYNNQNSLLEASFTNTLKVASMKLRNSFTKMSDKEKSISRNLDVGMNNFKKSIERAFTNDNREAVIKGSVLPSFSKVIKMCIINAGLIAIGQPVLAIIGTLGYFAVNGKFKAKERQMVIDEIEIEIDMCERYIAIAEQKNDMQALRQLLTTKKELERQRQRIKYKMRVEFGQKYYDSAAPTN